MSDVDVALNDKGQQYGNLDESSAIARVPRKGLVVCGDHKQTPGGLRKSDEARAFRRRLMRRPIALRGDTKFIPPYAGRYSPSVCARCARTTSSRVASAASYDSRCPHQAPHIQWAHDDADLLCTSEGYCRPCIGLFFFGPPVLVA